MVVFFVTQSETGCLNWMLSFQEQVIWPPPSNISQGWDLASFTLGKGDSSRTLLSEMIPSDSFALQYL